MKEPRLEPLFQRLWPGFFIVGIVVWGAWGIRGGTAAPANTVPS